MSAFILRLAVLTLFSLNAPILMAAALAAPSLGSGLTPAGGEQAGNAAGTIPPWSGGLAVAPGGYEAGKVYPNPYAKEKPILTIDANNFVQYRAQLTDGQIKLLQSYPDTFTMPIYPTHRSAAMPDWVSRNTEFNAQHAQLSEDGAQFNNAYGGIPFPIPKNGMQAIWNHLLRYQGTSRSRTTADIAAQRDGSFVPVVIDVSYYTPYYRQNGSFSDLSKVLYYYVAAIRAPSRLAGEALLVHETVNQVANPREAWGYIPGQRRVRRAPTIAYDTPVANSDGLRTADDTDMFNGAMDRYEWKLLGKREIYIPYNSYDLLDKTHSYKEIIQPGHLNPKFTRYELHRVWEVEAQLKTGARNLYSKRRFYLDEDSWSIVVADKYDSRGELWRISMAYLVNYYDQPTTMSAVDVYFDVQSRRYQAQGLANEEKFATRFSDAPEDESIFKPTNLPSVSGR